jgi:hypothetical protein
LLKNTLSSANHTNNKPFSRGFWTEVGIRPTSDGPMYTGDATSMVDAARKDKDNALDLLSAMKRFSNDV